MITINATGDTTLHTAGKYCKEDILVKVPVGGGEVVEPTIWPLEITENGTYSPLPGVDGYSPITVNVSIPDGYIQPSGTLDIDENGTYDITEYANVTVAVPDEPPVLQEKTVTENGEVTPDSGYDGLSKVVVNVAGSGGGDSNNYTKFIATTDSTTSFIIENPLGGIAKMVSIKACSPTITSSRKIHECCLNWDIKLGAIKAYYSSGNVTYVMTGIEGTPNNGNFRMTDGFITVYRFNSATTWDTNCAYEVEIYQ